MRTHVATVRCAADSSRANESPLFGGLLFLIWSYDVAAKVCDDAFIFFMIIQCVLMEKI
jgi:hypothetical protein